MPDTTTKAPVAISPFDLGGQVTTEYGAPSAFTGTPHTGVDIGGLPIGTAIPAFVGGTVSKVWRDAIGGIQVMVTTPEGFQQVYAHLIAVNVQPGQQVTGADTVGYLGNTGQVTGPHLHYEVRPSAGGTVDPRTFLSEFLSPSSPSGTGPSASGPRPRSLAPIGTQSGPPKTDACAAVPGETVQAVKNYIRDIGALSAVTPGGDAAALVKAHFTTVPLACLQQVAYQLGSESATTGQTDFFSQGAQVLADLQSGHLWARFALTGIGVSLIVIGVILYAKPSAVGEATKIVRAAA